MFLTLGPFFLDDLSFSIIFLSNCLFFFFFSSGKLAICIERKKSLNLEKGVGHKAETSNAMVIYFHSLFLFGI